MDPLLDKKPKPPDIPQNQTEVHERHFDKLRNEFGQRANTNFIEVINYNENEEATCIEIALLLNKDYFSRLIVVPLLSLLTVFVFPLKLYWSKRMQMDWLYKRALSLDSAKYLMIVGRGKLTL